MSETKKQLLELAAEKIASMFSKTEVKLQEAKLVDGTKVVIEEDDIFVLTDEGERLPAPVGEHELESGEIVIVKEEGKIAETKTKEEEEEEVEAKKDDKEMDLASEVEKLKKEMAEVKEMMKPKEEVEASKEEETKEKTEVEASKEKEPKEETKVEASKEEIELSKENEVEKVTHSPEKDVKKQKLTLHSQNRVRGIKDGVYSNLFK